MKKTTESEAKVSQLYAASAMGLKSIANNKSPEAYFNATAKEEVEALKKKKQAEAQMVTATFRPQPFISPITGHNLMGNITTQVAHGVYEKDGKGELRPKGERSAKTLYAEMLRDATQMTFHMDNNQLTLDHPIQGRLVFSTQEGDIEIDANLVRVKIDDNNNFAQYDRTLADVLDEQFGKFKGPKPFRRIVETPPEPEPTFEVVQQESVEVSDNDPSDFLYHEDPLQQDDLLEIEQLEAEVEDYLQETAPTLEAASKDFYYETPSLDLLEDGDIRRVSDEEWISEKMELLEATFTNFGIKVQVTGNYIQGATVTQFEVAPEPGTKVSRVVGLTDDLKLSLSVSDLRVEPIPGKNTIGVEIPNLTRRAVRLKDILTSPEFVLHDSPLYIGLGEDIGGTAVYTDILTMPHGLIAGQTGSGKSVCINTLLISILYKATPDDVRLMLIDPKRVEMTPYNDIPHLVTPVITDEKKAATALSWAVDEMERRYDLFAKNGVRDIQTFNKRRYEFKTAYDKIPYIVIVIDELADLMMVSANEVEDCIMRLTQKARAAGIHLIVATQRPTVDVVTGTIKSNIPTRMAFAVAQANDSRVILDRNGAESLLGRGDMLISQNGDKTQRVQGSFVDDAEVLRVVEAVKAQGAPRYLIAEEALEKRLEMNSQSEDPLEYEAMMLFVTKQTASISSLQTKFRVGYNRAARIIDHLEAKGWISEPIGAMKKRDVLMTEQELNELFDK